MYEGIDTIVLYEELAYEDVLPVHWRLLPSDLDHAVFASFAERNLRLLQACAALEEHVPADKKQDEIAPHAEIVRLDLKVNLLLDLVGQLLAASSPRPKAVPIRFNALGAAWEAPTPLPQPGSQGVLEIYLRECLVQPLRLVGRIAGVATDGKVKAKFIHPGESIADLIEKLAFRRHRRQIAGARHPKK
jgi:hypothetical protein